MMIQAPGTLDVRPAFDKTGLARSGSPQLAGSSQLVASRPVEKCHSRMTAVPPARAALGRRVAGMLRPHAFALGLISLMTVVSAGFGALDPLMLKWFFDSVEE